MTVAFGNWNIMQEKEYMLVFGVFWIKIAGRLPRTYEIGNRNHLNVASGYFLEEKETNSALAQRNSRAIKYVVCVRTQLSLSLQLFWNKQGLLFPLPSSLA
jgi:hypothetical protein